MNEGDIVWNIGDNYTELWDVPLRLRFDQRHEPTYRRSVEYLRNGEWYWFTLPESDLSTETPEEAVTRILGEDYL